MLFSNAHTENGETKSYRDIVHQYTKGHPWAQFGIDFCIGSQADHPINDRQMMFAPFYLMDAFAGARITNTSDNKALVASTKKIIDCEPDVSDSAENDIWNMLTPIRLSLLVFIAIGMATVYGLRKKKSLWGLDIAVFAAAGIAGCIIAFLALFSKHPTVGSNYLLFVFHPGHLLCLPFFINDERKRRKKQVSSAELHSFNTFYSAFSGNTTKFRLSSITFGTLFADTFCKQSYSDIQKS